MLQERENYFFYYNYEKYSFMASKKHSRSLNILYLLAIDAALVQANYSIKTWIKQQTRIDSVHVFFGLFRIYSEMLSAQLLMLHLSTKLNPN